jgi:hypothetical protein
VHKEHKVHKELDLKVLKEILEHLDHKVQEDHKELWGIMVPKVM